jgi:hypothetical protein
MFKIFRKIGQSDEILDKLYTQNPIEALAHYQQLCTIRTDLAGCVLLIEDSLQIGYYRTDSSYSDEGREQTDMRHWIFDMVGQKEAAR